MSRIANNIQIKIETNELQTYLDTFNKEIEEGSRSLSSSFVDAADLLNAHSKNDDDETGTYFVDEAGNYYYQATKDAEPIPTDPPENAHIVAEDSDIEEITLAKIPKTAQTKHRKNASSSFSRNASKRAKISDDNNDGDVDYIQLSYALGDENDVEVDDMNENEDVTNNGEEVEQDDEENENEGEDEDEDDEDGDGDSDEKEEVFEFDENEESSEKRSNFPTKVVCLKPKNSKSTSHQCPHSNCEYVSSKRYLLARHMKCHSDYRPFKCSVCERGFKTNASLQNHANTHTGNKPYQCKFCASTFTTSGELVRHVRYKHTHEKPHKCFECNYASVELSKLKRHIRCHTGERPFQCPHCTYASPDTFKLKRHMRTHTGEKPYECDICHSKFTQSNSLKQHKLIHSVGDKPVFQCHLCPTTCGRKTDLRIHIQKLHTSDRPLTCKRCNKSCPDRYSYKVHCKTHDGEKCFKCDLCPYASISQRHLDSHLLIHTDQKPFECKLCGQCFRQKQLLRRHQNLYHNKDYVPPPPQEKTHSCPDCKRAFSRKGNLMRHMATHDPDSVVHEVKVEKQVNAGKQMENDDGTFEALSYVEEEEEDYEVEEEEEQMEGDEEAMETYIETAASDITNFEEVMIKKEDERELVTLEGIDDQQYMVVEIIQSDDENDDLGFEEDKAIKHELDEEFVISELTEGGINIIKGTKNQAVEMDDCFGFSESEELLDESIRSDSDVQDDCKNDIKLLEILQ
ncbi:transcriptional repressor CTCFL [Eupeodes corollae]|uniref:transcriptional repressor CTCFL n=1 Tax=Eupeodes corollae TaxID=290404 RepID=UPI00248F9E1C|nr:transcriptional repressor CTCFL [Eupeodes corollae]XP_055910318.1 transcriptional repressor CTCFL [Eupeodes corollae]XP_055910319.1 transcriptional repressor CTCFL [Eupeodes corollae]XP_055910320.1 transcriptional repressor CTCFL [Eupeodes corollae]